VRYQRADIPLKLTGLLTAREFFSGCFAEQDPSQESLWIAHLDRDARCIHLSTHAGDADGVRLPLRTIIVDAALRGSASILLAHNHPSGDARPSESDLHATRRLAIAAQAIDCALLDHLIFAGSSCTSLRRLGLL
jgi:DNA repair protein RadC